MLKRFFYRTSPFVYGMNVLSFGFILVFLYQAYGTESGLHLGWATYFLIFCWVYFNALNWIPWYPGTKGKLGIRLHFQKTVVPMVYILPVAFVLKLFGVGEVYLAIFGALFLPMFYVSFILLYFHFRDTSDLMPGYFTHNFYLNEEDTPCTR